MLKTAIGILLITGMICYGQGGSYTKPPSWGTITGIISNQTDLVNQNALTTSNLIDQINATSNALVQATAIPTPIIYASSNTLNIAAGNYQKIIVTNTYVQYMPNPALYTNYGVSLVLDIDKGTNSFTFATPYCNTNGIGSFNSVIVTNSGVSEFFIYLPCAGTNILLWRILPLT